MKSSPSSRPTSLPIRLLLVGPLPISGDVIGGTKVSFAKMVANFEASDDFDATVVNSSRRVAGRNPIMRLLVNFISLIKVALATWQLSKSADAMIVNYSAGAAFTVGPMFGWIAKRRQIPIVTRLFGGDFGDVYDAASSRQKTRCQNTILQSDLLLLQAQPLCDHFRQLSDTANIQWFPTTRDIGSNLAERNTRPCRKFLFLSQLRPEKGIIEALEASEQLPDGCELSVYGAAMAGMDLRLLDDYPRATYYGELDPTEIEGVMSAHDALLFPSYHDGEGMPGVVVEAMQNGMPVIVADWKFAPELVGHTAGLIIPIKDSGELAGAMAKLASDPELFRRLSEGAVERGDRFRSAFWQRNLESWCLELVTDQQKTAKAA